MNILNFGSLNLDYVYMVDHFVQPGETISATSQSVNPGGKGLNQSMALARAGSKVFHAGRIGVGGESLKVLLSENGVDISFLETVSQLQGNAVIQVVPSGENSILLFGGSNQSIGDTQIERTLDAFCQGDWLVLQNEINNLGRIVELASSKGMKIVLNPSPYDARLDSVDFGKLSWLLVNEVEAAQVANTEDPEDAWTRIHARYPELSVLITLGRKGSIAWQVGADGQIENVFQPAFRVCAVDTTAAGDTYTGYFLNGLTGGLPLKECMRRASMASAISVTRQGAACSIPTYEEVTKALRQ